MTLYPNADYSNADVQHFTVVFDRFIASANESMIQFDGSAMNCQVQPFNHGGVSFDIAIENCSDGNLRIEVLANSVSDNNQNVGPAAEVWSNYTQISRAIPIFEITGVNPLGPSTLEFHLTSTFGIWLPNENALSFADSGCRIAASNFSNADIWYYLDSCTSGVDFQIALAPYSLTDMFHNAGPAEVLYSQTINLQAATPVDPIIDPGTPQPYPSGSVTANASPSPSTSSLATEPWHRLAPGNETGATQVPVATPTETATETPSPKPTAEQSSDEKQQPLVVKPDNQDPPQEQVAPPIVDAPRPFYAPTQIESDSDDPSASILGISLIVVAAAITIAVITTQVRRTRKVRKPRIAIS